MEVGQTEDGLQLPLKKFVWLCHVGGRADGEEEKIGEKDTWIKK
jgi:hypothetical protein